MIEGAIVDAVAIRPLLAALPSEASSKYSGDAASLAQADDVIEQGILPHRKSPSVALCEVAADIEDFRLSGVDRK